MISLNPLHLQHVQAFAKTFHTSDMFCEREKETQTQTDRQTVFSTWPEYHAQGQQDGPVAH